ILIVLQKLCEKSMLYPTCYTLDGIEDISPKGAGGFCDIYQGRYQGQNLCLKVVRLYEKQDQHEMLKAHSREAILWSQLEHPNIAPFYGVFCLKEAHGRICLLSPLMENGNIVEYLKKESQVPHFLKLHDIASGLEYLHNENIVHGDLKGINVLVDQFSNARLTDFGLSKITTDGTLGFTNTTKLASGRTAGWASPELLEDDARPTRESDIWAFGCVCYEVLTGLSPFQGCSDFQIVAKLMKGYLPAQSADTRLDSDDAINQKIWHLVEQCWSSEPKQRPKCSEI
ncbi:hypothetical protein AGABI2DRAFT_52342, partial [Agaricus bisporus var. bisporus H97]|uniref:hypothetical protein n=1 Tax=Agaricus bisporus var. bisporus (strain H97 / ATCC MYA-4626 / FGSC 10389) TaxID=936046 RepID=UPI00029F4F65